MAGDEYLRSQISRMRRQSFNGRDIDYDLREGHSWKSPRGDAKAMANALFENDIRNWMQVSDNYFDCTAGYSITLICKPEQADAMHNLLEKSLDHLREYILPREYHSELRKWVFLIGIPAGLPGILNPITAISMTRSIRKKAIKSKIRKVVEKISEYIRIEAK